MRSTGVVVEVVLVEDTNGLVGSTMRSTGVEELKDGKIMIGLGPNIPTLLGVKFVAELEF